MVRMVRIAGVGALVLSGLIVASVWVPIHLLHLGVSDNENAQKYLSAPSAVEIFNESRGATDSSGQDKTSPLVRQASALEAIIRPRVDPSSARTSGESKGPAIRTDIVRPVKFDLIGISYSPSDPQASFAFIRWQADNTYQWIQQGSVVGHQTVKEIKSGSIICTDGQEVPVTASPDTASLLETSSASVAAAAPRPPLPGVRPASFPGVRPPTPDVGGVPASPAPADSGRLSEQEKERMSELANLLKEKLQRSSAAGQVDSNTASQDQAAVEKLISEIKSSRVSTEEAQKLDNLGEQLNGATEKRAAEKHRELLRRLYPNRSAQQ
jgi:hypothetical protein